VITVTLNIFLYIEMVAFVHDVLKMCHYQRCSDEEALGSNAPVNTSEGEQRSTKCS